MLHADVQLTYLRTMINFYGRLISELETALKRLFIPGSFTFKSVGFNDHAIDLIPRRSDQVFPIPQ